MFNFPLPKWLSCCLLERERKNFTRKGSDETSFFTRIGFEKIENANKQDKQTLLESTSLEHASNYTHSPDAIERFAWHLSFDAHFPTLSYSTIFSHEIIFHVSNSPPSQVQHCVHSNNQTNIAIVANRLCCRVIKCAATAQSKKVEKTCTFNLLKSKKRWRMKKKASREALEKTKTKSSRESSFSSWKSTVRTLKLAIGGGAQDYTHFFLLCVLSLISCRYISGTLCGMLRYSQCVK